MAVTGIVKDPIYLEHKTGSFHPESTERLKVLYEMLEDQDIAGNVDIISPRKATREEIQMVHDPSYFERVAATEGLPHSSLDPDTQTSEKSYEAALFAAGGLLLGIDRIFEEKNSNVFALVRPPGHHAEAGRGMGFCIFNNIAIAALYAIKTYNIKKVLIVDWDLHHGNATQHSFEGDKRVLYFSTHQYPYYPGTGSFEEVGKGDARGFNVNVPLQVGNGDPEYYKIFKQVLEPIAFEFEPELVLVSAGFDIYFKDPLGGMEVTPEGFAALTDVLMTIAKTFAGDRMLITLEGGYHLGGLRDGTKAVIKHMMGDTTSQDLELPKKNLENIGQKANYPIKRAISVQREFWGCF